jgi:hypothetical protein
MTEAARAVLRAFETLSPDEQHEVAVEVLRRWVATDEIPEAAFIELAEGLFLGLDAEEARA